MLRASNATFGSARLCARPDRVPHAVDRRARRRLAICAAHQVSLLASIPSLEVVSLSVNKVRSLEPFAACGHLTELYMRKNDVSDLLTVAHLQALPDLRILWLCDNPCASHKYYRPLVINLLPSLTKLDMHDVTDHERSACKTMAARDAELAGLLAEAARRSAAGRRRGAEASDSKARDGDAATAGSQGGEGVGAGGGVAAAPVAGESDMTAAVLLLLHHLGEGGLATVRDQCDALLASKRSAPPPL